METVLCPHGSNAYGFLRAYQKYNLNTHSDLTFADPAVDNQAALLHVVKSAADLIFLRPSEDGLSQIVRHLRCRGGRHSSIHILADVEGGQLFLCGRRLGLRELYERAPEIIRIGRSVTRSGRILIGAGRDPDGRGARFLQMVAGYAGVAVESWTDEAGREL